VIIETVGVGQDEVDVMRTADVSIVVLVPGTGDDVQALKAGLMEIADIFVVNKADREGADRLVASIDAMLSLQGEPRDGWRPPVIRTTATTGEGIGEVWRAVERFRTAATDRLTHRRASRAAHDLRTRLAERLVQSVEAAPAAGGRLTFDTAVAAISDGRMTPHAAAAALLDTVAAATASADVTGAAGPTGATAAAPPRAAVGPPAATDIAIDHVGIAVADVAATETFFAHVLGLVIGPPETVTSQGVRVRFIGCAGARLELLESLAPDTTVARFLDKRGPGLHHVALAVSDLDGLLHALAARGVRLIDTTPRTGAGGSRIAFVHPASTGGVLVEFKERK
jgi:LAO/AO transport system kinase